MARDAGWRNALVSAQVPPGVSAVDSRPALVLVHGAGQGCADVAGPPDRAGGPVACRHAGPTRVWAGLRAVHDGGRELNRALRPGSCRTRVPVWDLPRRGRRGSVPGARRPPYLDRTSGRSRPNASTPADTTPPVPRLAGTTRDRPARPGRLADRARTTRSDRPHSSTADIRRAHAGAVRRTRPSQPARCPSDGPGHRGARLVANPHIGHLLPARALDYRQGVVPDALTSGWSQSVVATLPDIRIRGWREGVVGVGKR